MKYSMIPNGFIEDFFNIAMESCDENEPTIDFDKITKWLISKKMISIK